MKPEMPRDLQRWEMTRRKGRVNFVLQRGILLYALPMFVVMTFIVGRQDAQPLTAGRIVIGAVVWTLGGVAFGLIMWKINEGRYQKFLAKQGAPAGRA